jgi:NTE family protein
MTIGVDLNGDIMGKATKPGQNYPTVAGFDMLDAVEDAKEMQNEEKGFIKRGIAKRLFRREDKAPSLFGVMVSSLGIMQDRLTRSRLAGDPPDIHIRPKIGHIGLLEFEKAEELIALGEEAALEAIEDIRDASRILLPPVYQEN